MSSRGSELIKRMLPHVVAVVLFIVLPYIYFSPLLQGRLVAQHDRSQWLGTAKELIDHRAEHGEQSLWTNTVFSGMPSVLVSLDYPKNVVSYIDKALGFLQRPARYIMLTMLGFYVLLLTLRVNPWTAIAGAVAYGFSTYFFIIVGAGHNAKSHAICYMAPMLGGIIALYRRKYLGGGVLFALSLALSLWAGHLQITYYTFFIIGAAIIAFLWDAVRNREYLPFIKASLVLLVGSIVALGANFNRLYNTWDYGRESIRGRTDLTLMKASDKGGLDRDYATSWSYGLEETPNLLIPRFNGGSSSALLDAQSKSARFVSQLPMDPAGKTQILRGMPVYWGPQPITSGPVYLGAGVIFLFVVSLFAMRGAMKWALAAVGALAIFLAWGKYFPLLTNLFFDVVPGYNKFRTVSMILVICELVVPLLAFWGLAQWQTGELDNKRLIKGLKWGGIIVCGLLLLLWAAGPAIFSFSSPYDEQYTQAGFPDALMQALRDDRISLMRGDAMRSLIFVILTAGVVGVALWKHMKPAMVCAVLTAVILLDMWPVAKRYDGVQYVSKQEYEKPFPQTEADRAILQDTSYYRVYNLTVSPFNDASTSYYHHSVGGYHGAKMRRYQEFVDNYAKFPTFANMLNAKYLIVQGNDRRPMVQRNDQAMGNAWFVDSLRVVPNADAELRQVGEVDLHEVAVIDGSKFSAPACTPRDVEDTIWLAAHGTDWQTYQYLASEPRYAVFSEIYYPRGWTASVDGQELPIQRVNYLLRGVLLPAGANAVTFKFTLPMFYVGQWIDLAFGLLLLAGVIIWLVRAVRQLRATSELTPNSATAQ